jgi:chitinase
MSISILLQSPLYEQGWGPADLSVNNCVGNWLSAGTSPDSINIGLAFYGRSFAQAMGLNQVHGGTDNINWQVDEGTPLYYNIMSKLTSMTTKRHEPSSTQYAYFSTGAGGGLVTYDDEQAICDKTQYVMDNNLNGFIIWELSGDVMEDLSTPLLDMVNIKLADSSLECDSFSRATNPIPTHPTPSATKPTPTSSKSNCGDGNRGNGICSNGQCCSQWGWCGTTAEHCN